MIFISINKQNLVTLPHRVQRKHKTLLKTKEKSKSKKEIPKKKVTLELLHQILGHRSTRSQLDGYAVDLWH